MSNPMYLSRTRFETLDQAGDIVSVTYGACIYDDIGCAYCKFIESLEELMALDADGLVEYMRENSETANAMIGMVLELGDEFYVDDELYSGGDGEESDDDNDDDGDDDEAASIRLYARPVSAALALEVDKAIMAYFANQGGATDQGDPHG